MMIKIKKLHPKAVIPSRAHATDAGMDLVATSREINDRTGLVEYGTGLAMEIPEGYVGLIFPRSSICKMDLLLSNAVGVVDSGYRGEIKAKYKMIGFEEKFYEVGDRIAQLIILPYPKVEFEAVEELSKSERGIGGYGSTGN